MSMANVFDSHSHFTVSKKDFINEYLYPELKRKYKILNIMDEGGFGRIYNAIDKVYKTPCVIKQIRVPELEKERLQLISEFELLKKLDHPNIIRLIEAFRSEEELYLVTELCKGNNLVTDLKQREKLSEAEAAYIIWQILQAVYYCHKQDICHRDIKMENIVAEEDTLTIKLIDFGFACLFDPEEGMSETVGTTMYMAPEVLQRKKYNQSSDMWSIGIVTYILLTGLFPFPCCHSNQSTEIQQLSEKIITGQFNRQFLRDYSKEAVQFVNRLLEVDSKNRYSAEEALCDHWIMSQKEIHEQKINPQSKTMRLQNLRDFTQHPYLKILHVIKTLIAHKCKRKEGEQKQIFLNLNTEQNGSISVFELTEALLVFHEDYGQALEEAHKILLQANLSQSGSLLYSEWLVASANKDELLTDENLDHVFKFFDKANSGFLGSEEMIGAFVDEKIDIDNGVVEEFRKHLGEERLDFSQFCHIMRQY